MRRSDPPERMIRTAIVIAVMIAIITRPLGLESFMDLLQTVGEQGERTKGRRRLSTVPSRERGREQKAGRRARSFFHRRESRQLMGHMRCRSRRNPPHKNANGYAESEWRC